MNVFAVFRALVGLLVAAGAAVSTADQGSQRSRRICGGRSMGHPLRHSGSPSRSLHHWARTLDAMNIMIDQIITDYRQLNLRRGTDISCIKKMMPEVTSVFEVKRENMIEELTSDNQVVLDLISVLNLIQSNGNSVDLDVTKYIFSLENLAYDGLCAVNKVVRALNEHLPRSVDVPMTTDACNVGDNVYLRLVRDFELFNQMKIVLRQLYVKYHFSAKLYLPIS